MEFVQWHNILHFNCSLLLLRNQSKQGPIRSVDYIQHRNGTEEPFRQNTW